MKISTSKSILISDPCYILDDSDYDEFLGDSDYDYSVLSGIFTTEYELEATGIGDGTWEVYEISNPGLTLKYMNDLVNNCVETGTKQGRKIGEYSADSGMIGVFLESDVRNYTEYPKELIDKGCICRIPNFTGEIYPVFDKNDELHYVGISESKAFYTI